MRGVKEFCTLAAATWRNTVNVACLFFHEGRQSLLQRARATTELQELAVQQRQVDLDKQRASYAVELARDIEKIKDPEMREALVQAFLFREPGKGSESKEPSALADLSNSGRTDLRRLGQDSIIPHRVKYKKFSR